MVKHLKNPLLLLLIMAAFLLNNIWIGQATESKDVILATTTSTVDTGLLDVLIPKFEKSSGYRVKVLGVGSGQALAMGEKGDADALLTHAPSAEKPLVDKSLVIDYQLVMHNDFVIIGPKSDPAKIKKVSTAKEAFKLIADAGALFISRGDDSGTNKKELAIWSAAGIKPTGSWYQQSGSGMGQTLQIAFEKQGYTLTDRGTYYAFKDKIDLQILVEGDKNLLNIYHVMRVNPDKFSRVNTEGAKALVGFFVDPETQKFIAEFGKAQYGSSLFIADAGKSEESLK